MPINRAALRRKLGAIERKDVPAMVAAHVRVPGLGTDYTEAELQAFLNRIAAIVRRMLDATEAQIDNAKDRLLERLNAQDLARAQRILDGDGLADISALSTARVEQVLEIVLYRLAKGSD